MNDFDKDIFLEHFMQLYEGVAEGSPTWFVSPEAGSGVFGSIEELTALQASATPCGELSIAAHVEHLRWSLAFAMTFYRGQHASPDWSASWGIRTVEERGWVGLREELRAEYDDLVAAISEHEDWSNRVMRAGTMALVPHGAYHLGVIRMLRKQVLGDS